jgi:hypothetical protein
VGGSFDFAGGVKRSNIAGWNSSGWFGTSFGLSGYWVYALTAHDDGSGPALYAGGEFSSGGTRIARWNGSSWSGLDLGVNLPPHALAVHDDGSGPALFVGGEFTTVFQSGDAFLAKWGCAASAGEAVASSWNSQGINSDVLLADAIVIGEPWELSIALGHSHGASGVTNVHVRSSCVNGPNLTSPSGHPFEILVNGPLALTLTDAHDGSAADFEPDFLVPLDSALLGLDWAAQGTVLGGGRADLTSARRGVVGSVDAFPDPP